MDAYIALVRKLARWLDNVAAVVLFGNCALVVLNVITRSPVFEAPVFGVYEMVCYFSLISVSLSISNCSMEGGHTNMTFLLEKLSDSKRKALEVATGTVALVNFCLITWNLGAYMIARLRIGEVSPVMRVPFFLIVGFVFLGFIPLAMAQLAGIFEAAKRKRAGL